MGKRPHRLELTVELDPRGEPISGCVTDDRGRRRTFSGWLDLMDVLDERHHVEAEPIDGAPNEPGGIE
jgi:hypothetical protein